MLFSNKTCYTPTVSDEELKIEDIQIGKGEGVKEGDRIVVDYRGTFTDGREFDSSYARNQPFEVQIGAGYVIAGWDMGIIGMKKGGKRKLTIPYQYGYGKYGQGDIPGFTTLVFEIELLDIK